MNKQIIILAVLVCFSMAGNYLDNYFCTQEICQQYQVDCKAAELKTDEKKFCDAKDKFLKCVKAINLDQPQDELNKMYNACRSDVTYENGANFFYFLNCQVNCGYQSLWLNCGKQLNYIGACPNEGCQDVDQYNAWNTVYTKCVDDEKKNTCGYVFKDLLVDCQNSVNAKCKISASEQVGKSNTYVDLMYCNSNSIILASLSFVTLFAILLF